MVTSTNEAGTAGAAGTSAFEPHLDHARSGRARGVGLDRFVCAGICAAYRLSDHGAWRCGLRDSTRADER